MPRKEQGWITFQTSEEERKLLEEFCQLSQRTKTEVLREMVRNLNQQTPPTESLLTNSDTEPLPTKKGRNNKKNSSQVENKSQVEVSAKKPLKVSSRNILQGVVTKVVSGPVNSEVRMKIVHEVELTSVITSVSALDLEVAEGDIVYAVIKSTDIVIAKE